MVASTSRKIKRRTPIARPRFSYNPPGFGLTNTRLGRALGRFPLEGHSLSVSCHKAPPPTHPPTTPPPLTLQDINAE